MAATTVDWLRVLAAADLSDLILANCGVLCLGRLRIASKTTRIAIDQNDTTRLRLITRPSSGLLHEHYVFWMRRRKSCSRLHESKTKTDVG